MPVERSPAERRRLSDLGWLEPGSSDHVIACIRIHAAHGLPVHMLQPPVATLLVSIPTTIAVAGSLRGVMLRRSVRSSTMSASEVAIARCSASTADTADQRGASKPEKGSVGPSGSEAGDASDARVAQAGNGNSNTNGTGSSGWDTIIVPGLMMVER